METSGTLYQTRYRSKLIWGLAFFLSFSCALVVVWLQNADGPRAFLPGGALRSGHWQSGEQVDWAKKLAYKPMGNIELELVQWQSSRTTGVFVHQGQLIVPCDLGFIWRRVPDTSLRWLLNVIYWFKNWHIKAQQHGEAVVRLQGNLYPKYIQRITNPELLVHYRAHVQQAAQTWLKAELLSGVEVANDEIWFFALSPRNLTSVSLPGAYTPLR